MHFGTSEQISTYEKLSLLSIKSIFLALSSGERQRRLIQTKPYYKPFYSVWNGTSHKPLKVAAAKKSFPSVYVNDKTCFDEYLFQVIRGSSYESELRKMTSHFELLTPKFL